jgi:hypothetical protein
VKIASQADQIHSVALRELYDGAEAVVVRRVGKLAKDLEAFWKRIEERKDERKDGA